MSLKNIKANHASTKGFTIVELLIVIVVIGILAAITIVAYNGVTARANTSSAQAAATNVAKKAEAYNAELNSYPSTLAALTGAASSTTYNLPAGAVALQTTAMSAKPSSNPEKTIVFNICGTGASSSAPTTAATVTTQLGLRVDYWNFTTNTMASVTAGTTTGTVSSNSVGCGPAAS